MPLRLTRTPGRASRAHTQTQRQAGEALTAVADEEELDEVVVVGAGPSRRRSHRAVPPRSYRRLAGERGESGVITRGRIEETLGGEAPNWYRSMRGIESNGFEEGGGGARGSEGIVS